MALEQIASQQKSFTDRLKERKDVANQYKQAYLKQLQEAGQSDYKIGTTSMFGSLGPMQKALTGIVESAGEDVSGTGLTQKDLLDYQLKGLDKGYELKMGDNGLEWKPISETSGKPLGDASASEAKLLGMVSSGYESLDRLKEKFGKGEKASVGDWLGLVGAKSGENIPLMGDITPWGRQTEQDLFNVADTILRLRTGAAANEQEVQNYIKDKLRPLDPKATKKEALDLLQTELDTVIKAMGYEPSQLRTEEKVSESGFDREAAKAAGYTDEEIDNYLKNQ